MNSINNVADGIAVYGKVSTYIKFFFGTCIALIFFCVGFFINKSQKKENEITSKFIIINAIITNKQIMNKQIMNKNIHNVSSELTISYIVNNVNYTNKLFVTEQNGKNIYLIGNTIQIKYDPSNPQNIIQNNTNILSNYAGYIFMSIACIVFILLLINVILVSTNNTYATINGLNSITHI
jgi:hypothetical protein